MNGEKVIDETGAEIPAQNCGNCIYANSIPKLGQDNMPLVGQSQLVCMHSPPQVLVLALPTPGGIQTAFRTQFPAVADSMMCYQHDYDPDFDPVVMDALNDGSIDPH
jgi:hypothetical protein